MPTSRLKTAIGAASLVGLLFLAGAVQAQERPPIAEKLAKTYGLDGFANVEAIRFTFSAQLPAIDVSRAWTWETKTGQVTYQGKDKSGKAVTVTYSRSQPDTQGAEIEPWFVNDEYWLLLPFHATWDYGATIEDIGPQKLPVGDGSAEKVVMRYPSSGASSSPGDTWDLYIGADGRIEAITFHRGGSAKPNLVHASWTDYKKAGPLLFSLEHRGTADGQPLHVGFSNVAVKLAGSNDWIEAK